MFAFAGVSAPRGLRSSPHRCRVCPRRAPTRMCADSPAAPPPPPPPPPPPAAQPAETEADAPAAQREARAAAARLEAQKCELLAEQAALGAEKAQLAADRKRVEFEALKRRISRAKGEEVPSEEQVAAEAAAAAAEAAASAAVVKAAAPAVDGGGGESPPSADGPRGAESSKRTSAGPPGTAKPGTALRDMSPSDMMGPPLSELLGIDFPRIAADDILLLKEKVMSMGIFYVTEVDRSPFDERVVFRGNLRVDAGAAIAELQAAAEREGLSERVRLFLLMDPRPPTGDDEGEKPVVVALPAAAVPNQTTTPAAVLTVIAALLTIFTALSYGVGIFGLNPAFLRQLATETLEAQQALYTLPISVGALGIVLAHEIAHRIAAKVNDIKLGLPFFLPSLQVGTYGTITPLQSYPKRREQLFDLAVSGPLVGTVISVTALVAGMLLTAGGDVADWFPQIPSGLFNGSVLVGALGKLILPAALRDQATVAVHPLLVVGYTGMLVNALNLIPIGRLDGGRIVQALYGRTVAARVTGVTFVLQGFATIVGNSSLLLFWGLICVFLQREPDYPCIDEVSEPSDARFALGLGMLFFMLAVLVPFPEAGGM
jgi:membrane-associated protease RseP (regulator of RpoE activity)